MESSHRLTRVWSRVPGQHVGEHGTMSDAKRKAYLEGNENRSWWFTDVEHCFLLPLATPTCRLHLYEYTCGGSSVNELNFWPPFAQLLKIRPKNLSSDCLRYARFTAIASVFTIHYGWRATLSIFCFLFLITWCLLLMFTAALLM